MPLMRIDEEKDELGVIAFCICCSIIGRVIRETNDELRFGGLILAGIFFMILFIPSREKKDIYIYTHTGAP